MLPSVLAGAIGSGFLEIVILQRLRGAPIVESLKRGLGRVLLTCLIVDVLMMAGLALFVIPGVGVAIFVFVAVEAAIAEKVGPLRALARSIALTRGHRWHVFCLMVVTWGPVLGLSLVLSKLQLGAAAIDIGVRFPILVLVMPFLTAVSATTYLELRRIKEGAAEAELAAVFD